jgi:hypothetical protein
VEHVAQGQRVWIGSLSEADTVTPVLAVLTVPGQPQALLTIEYRTNVGDDVGIAPAVVVHSIGAHDVGTGHDAVNPPWFEGTIEPVSGASFAVLGVRFDVATLFTGHLAGVEIKIG